MGSYLLDAPPLAAESRRRSPWQLQWVPIAATACAALLVVVVGVAWLQRSVPVQVAAHSSSVSAFADDLSDALFASADANALQWAADAPDVAAALQAGQPCTQERFFTGECNDQVSALLIDASDMEETVQ